MLIEATGKPFIYRWPTGEIRLAPGLPVELPAERAQKLLAKAGNKVRCLPEPARPISNGTVSMNTPGEWLTRWKTLAKATDGMLPDDPRLPLVTAALHRCDDHYKAGNQEGFEQEAATLDRLMLITPGNTITWERHDRTQQRAVVDFLHHDDTGALWIFLTIIQGMQVAVNSACMKNVTE